ncbi:GNAT family N-acetyltransferase [Hymenobacter koreensis]|uniref:GNAT family N-acetyltransferase n=1 Tax=Hymenobacter koreensis TaxID=1084523 RepID=A0ABP8JH64_9BACT
MNQLAPLPLAIPVLETPRLRLRGYRPTDFVPYLAMWQEQPFYRFLTPGPPSEEDVWTILLRSTGHWALQGFGFWAIEEKATGEFIGAVGFADGKRLIEPSIKGVPEIGWVLAAHTHGRGFATEAVTAALAWADTHFGPVRTVCIMHPDNRASRRVAEKFGYREYHRTSYKGQPTVMLERTAGT